MKKFKLISLAISFSVIFSNYCFAMQPNINYENNSNEKNVQFDEIKNNNSYNKDQFNKKNNFPKKKKSNLNLSKNKPNEEEFFEANFDINAIQYRKNNNNSEMLYQNDRYINHNQIYFNYIQEDCENIITNNKNLKDILEKQIMYIDKINENIKNYQNISNNNRANNNFIPSYENLINMNKKSNKLLNENEKYLKEIKKYTEYVQINNENIKENNIMILNNTQLQNEKISQLLILSKTLLYNNEEENKEENNNQNNIYEHEEENKEENNNQNNIYEHEEEI